ncbi:maltase-glucoamylase, intestinal-like [Limulus polyphemus]|uniref:Maltase-glucoamylase, intestinal-like n=1 Tax=Limulus polyphemus TaxID=6850 RepID=A0ABM1SC58_LIMPO|nr:maltase-glucoamylase, intestinal-like [Limulus polyphemus]
MTSRKCCTDDFSTLPWRLRCMCIFSILLGTLFIVLLPIYFFVGFGLNVKGFSPLLVTHDKNKHDWKPECLKSANLMSLSLVDCFPETTFVTEEQCVNRGCCWTANMKTRESAFRSLCEKQQSSLVPKCFYPSNYGYHVSGKVTSFYEGFEIPLSRIPSPSRYGDDIRNLRVRVERQTFYRLRIKFYDPADQRYEVPDPQIPANPAFEFYNTNRRQAPLYEVTYNITEVPFGIKIRRSNTGSIIFDTKTAGFTFSNQFLQVTIKLPSLHIYGLQEDGKMIYRMNQKQKPSTESSRFHPMYMCIEENGDAHGVLLFNSNAMEVEVYSSPLLTFRTTGGVLDFYIFMGPSPENVVQQYTESVGRPWMPPYWALGLHLGLYPEQKNANLQETILELHRKQIPMDVAHFYLGFSSKDFDYSHLKNLHFVQLTKQIHKKHLKITLNLSPGILSGQPSGTNPAYDVGIERGVFINSSWGHQPLEGKNWRGKVVFPDFGNSITQRWWVKNIENLHKEIKFDGLWITDNTPTNNVDGSVNGCFRDNLNYPPYIPARKRQLFDSTLCMDAWQLWDKVRHQYYDLYNLYGHCMSKATAYAQKVLFENKRSFVVTEATSVGTGSYAGHWIQFNFSRWSDLKVALPIVFEYGLSGIPYVGIKLCSRNPIQEEDLWLRWFELGAFFPLFEICFTHDDLMYIFYWELSKSFVDVLRRVTELRYELLPFLYTLFHHAHTRGTTVVRSLVQEFPDHSITSRINTQFLWGSSLLFTPIMEKGVNEVKAFFPQGLWYDYFTGERLDIGENGQWKSLRTSLYNITRPVNLHLRGGQVVVNQVPANNTAFSRRNPMRLLVALDRRRTARGDLFLDDGETLDSYKSGDFLYIIFTVAQNKLVIKAHQVKQAFLTDFDQVYLNQVTIYGLPALPPTVTINGGYSLTRRHLMWNSNFKVLQIQHIIIPVASVAGKTEISWKWN